MPDEPTTDPSAEPVAPDAPVAPVSPPEAAVETSPVEMAPEAPVEQPVPQVDESSTADELKAAAEARGINLPETPVAADTLLTVIRQVDAAQAASDNAQPPEQMSPDAIEREAGYVAPDYAQAQEDGTIGVVPPETSHGPGEQAVQHGMP